MILVVACGNPLRGDDGVAWEVVEALRPLNLNVRCIAQQQLTPELAETLGQAEGVVFVDAGRRGIPGDVRCELLDEQAPELSFTHTMAPSQLLTFARLLYGRCPRSALVSVVGADFGFSDRLS